MTVSPVGAPDGQRPVVAPQILLATVAHGTDSITVTLPANAETLIVYQPGNILGTPLAVNGGTTGMDYPGILMVGNADVTSGVAWNFQVSPAVDASVTVSGLSGGGGDAYIVADAGVRTVSEIALAGAVGENGASVPQRGLQVMGADGAYGRAFRADFGGSQFAVPVVPGTGSGDHPETEVSYVSFATSTYPVGIIDAPGVGKRIRVLGASLQTAATGFIPLLYPTGGIHGFAVCIGPGHVLAPLPSQGLALPDDTSLSVTSLGGAAECVGVIVYTIETA